MNIVRYVMFLVLGMLLGLLLSTLLPSLAAWLLSGMLLQVIDIALFFVSMLHCVARIEKEKRKKISQVILDFLFSLSMNWVRASG